MLLWSIQTLRDTALWHVANAVGAWTRETVSSGRRYVTATQQPDTCTRDLHTTLACHRPPPRMPCAPQLVSAEEYERWLQRGLSVAESRCEGSYHCATADCAGWCVYEDTVNAFHCPVCRKHNCLLCKVREEGGDVGLGSSGCRDCVSS